MKLSKKALALMMAMVMVFGGVVGGTVAWLTATTTDVVNTFTVGNINIELWEHELKDDGTLDNDKEVKTNTNYKMVPGNVLPKDPFVRVKANSEACYLFVKVVKSSNYDTYLEEYAIADGWTALDTTNYPGVYYRTQDATTADADPIYVLKNNQVTVKTTITKDDMDAIDGVLKEGQTSPTADQEIANRPTLTFKAAAVQKANINTVAEAWAQAVSLLS